MELQEAFRLLESRLPPGDKDARDAFDRVRRQITGAASQEAVAALGRQADDLNNTVRDNFTASGEAFRLLKIYLETDTPESKASLIKFLK
jgi:hypothetical protein